MSEARRLAATLLHDVGKYVARTARNLRDGQMIDGLFASMLLRDVYETYRGARASARFEELARPLAAIAPDARLDDVRTRLRAIDAREADARAGDAAALSAIARDARAIEETLRAIARERTS
ncbi:hypothetical protein [Sandaracinus amylolyticus]|uniref:Uncharacterized protein n=1 Tax=Sandaracinus amylolyticus TaxID=927083 RepID=A0A0F6W5H5_9BACT|nr:hypothetical protein [Sandaracinus amylolyticus]AKF07981.1 hypothetical protein DB32_005130 [Sandaracinus amylolyticus]